MSTTWERGGEEEEAGGKEKEEEAAMVRLEERQEGGEDQLFPRRLRAQMETGNSLGQERDILKS